MARKRLINVKSEQETLNTSVISELQDELKHGEIAVIYNSSDAEIATRYGEYNFAEFPSKAYVDSGLSKSLSSVTVNEKTATTANTVITLNGNDIKVGGDVVTPSTTVIPSNHTITSAFTDVLGWVNGFSIAAYSGQVESNVREAYILKDPTGVQKGSVIKIYKDSSLYNVYLGHVDDRITSTTNPTVIPGTGNTALCFIYLKTDGTYELVAVDVSSFLDENEFKDGLVVNNHVVKVKIDSTSEPYLTVGANGVKLSGVTNAINTEKLRAESAETALSNSISAVSGNVSTISGNVNTLSGNVNTVSGNVNTLSGNVNTLSGSVSSALTTISGNVNTISGNVSTISGNVSTISGNVSTISGNVSTISGNVSTVSGSVNTLSGNVVSAISALSGNVVSAISALSGNVTSAINELDYTDTGDTKKVVTSVSETNGVISVSRNYVTSDMVTISSASPSSTNVKEEWKLVNGNGVTLGSTIKVYKDSSLYSAYLGHIDDRITSTSNPTVISGTGDTALCFIYLKIDGTYELVAVNVNSFLEETEFKDGLDVNNHLVKVKIDSTSEPYLTVGANGVKLSPILVGRDINVSGEKVISSSDTIADALQTVVDNIIDDERVISNAILENHDAILELQEEVGETLSEFSINDTVVNNSNTAVTLDGSNVSFGGDIAICGVTIISADSSISGAVQTVVNNIIDDERVTSAALLELRDDVNDLSAVTESALKNVKVNNVTGTVSGNVASVSLDADDINFGHAVEYSGITVISSAASVSDAVDTLADVVIEDEFVTSRGLLELHNMVLDVKINYPIVINTGDTIGQKMVQTFTNGIIPSGTSVQSIFEALFG